MLRSYLFLLGFISAVLALNSDDGVPTLNVMGVFGGSVHLRCKFNKNETFMRIYFQKVVQSSTPEIFINGYYENTKLDVHPAYVNRTRVDVQQISMELSQLSLNDTGMYRCIVFRKNYEIYKTEFNLTVTGRYSVPVITQGPCSPTDPSDTVPSCTVTCWSSGGYPQSKVNWTMDGGGHGIVIREASHRFERDQHTGLWNVSQNATVNCTELINITCTVGGAVSSPFPLCVHRPPPVDLIVIIASVVVLLPVIIIAIVCTVKMYHRPQHQAVQGFEAHPLNPPNLQGQIG
ncbi:T-lymphocyte activation antigen CD80 [Brachyhypopomus gauderio]|uniref:T-lymphocyte activation antigen CD80 n=1 Tax=Brachyhypopomus gauderio TaxID=698409 RepID=UPI004041A7C8